MEMLVTKFHPPFDDVADCYVVEIETLGETIQ